MKRTAPVAIGFVTLVFAGLAALNVGCTAPTDSDLDDREDAVDELTDGEPTADELAMATDPEGGSGSGSSSGTGGGSLSITNGPLVAVQVSNGMYMVAENGGGQDVNANRGVVGTWEKFRVLWLGGSSVALQASSGHYLVAEGGGGGAVNANRSSIGSWETFTLVNLPGGKTALRTSLLSQYMVAEFGGGGDVNANRGVASTWETFTLVDQSTTPAVHSVCTTGARLTPGNGSCVLKICAARSSCCNDTWSATCVADVATVCAQTCP